MKKLLCRVGLHSRFRQCDKWGHVIVCRRCDWIGRETA